jgi:hypothetical protein
MAMAVTPKTPRRLMPMTVKDPECPVMGRLLVML